MLHVGWIFLEATGTRGQKKGDGGAELGFPSNGLYREGAVLSEKVRQMAPNATLTSLARSERPFRGFKVLSGVGYLPNYLTGLIIRVKLLFGASPRCVRGQHGGRL